MLRTRSPLVGFVAGAVLWFAAAPALAAQHYASPTGSAANWPCSTAANPCDLVTAIQGTTSQAPAAGDEVLIEGGVYTLTTRIIAGVPEDIQGAAGQTVQIDASGIMGDFFDVTSDSQQSELEHVRIYENGDADGTAVDASGNVVMDDDVVVASGSDETSIVMTSGAKLLDTVAVSTGHAGIAVAVVGFGGDSDTLRNVTAYASGTDAFAISGQVAVNNCTPTPISVSIRNTIVEAPDSTGATFGGYSACTGATINYNVDYSDFDPGKESLSPAASITPGAHNINQPATFANPSADAFAETAGSPTIDKGTNDPADGAFDPDGRARFLGSAPDIGAYEFPAADAVTGSVTGLSTNGATLNGTVDSEGTNLTTHYDFQYGTSTSYGSFSPTILGTEPGETVTPDPQAVSVPLTNLQPGTTYEYRLVADNSDGRTFGANHTFTTKAPATLKIVFAGTGHGTVNSSPDIGGCDTTCTPSGLTETPYTLTAAALRGATFTGWTGGGCSGTGRCTLTLTGNTTVTATFVSDAAGLSHVKLAGLKKHKPKLSFTVAVPASAPALRTVKITLPSQLVFKTTKHGVKLSVRGAKLKLHHGALTITLLHSASSIQVAIQGPAIKTLKVKPRRLDLIVLATNAVGTAYRLVHKL
jgi:Divergent InlB B-repeat domain